MNKNKEAVAVEKSVDYQKTDKSLEHVQFNDKA